MNYYEHHIGDYAEATAHLTFVEDAAYTRCIRKYYATEAPLPADIKTVQRLVGARGPEEKAAVEAVLREFFTLKDDGWHQARCDAEIAEFQAGEPERIAKRQNEEARLKKHREERAAIFAELKELGEHPKYNAPMSYLRDLLQRLRNAPATRFKPLLATALATPATLNATPPATTLATLATATQSPVPSPQSPIPITQVSRGESLPPQNLETSQGLKDQPGLDLDPSERNKPKPADPQEPPAFTAIRKACPKRAGSHRWPDALRAYRARLRENYTAQQMLEGMQRYAAFVRAEGKEGTNFVQQAATFLGPNKGFLEPWTSSAKQGLPMVAHEAREQQDLDQLKARRDTIGLAGFRDPHAGETADAYRRAQDDEWANRKRRPVPDLGSSAAAALRKVPA